MSSAADQQPNKNRDLEELKRILEEQRRALSEKMLAGIRDVRAENDKVVHLFAAEEFAHENVQDEMDISLIQLRSEMLGRVEAAIRRLEQGGYGRCAECGEPIASARLRALPFALRCVKCEAQRENGASSVTRRREATLERRNVE